MRSLNAILKRGNYAPVGTADKVKQAVLAELDLRDARLPFSMVSNPEFFKEDAAIDDFNRPDRIVIGTKDETSIKIMREMYAPFQRNQERLMVMDIRSAELTKYAANAMLATRISFMNELANLAGRVGADIEHVRKGMTQANASAITLYTPAMAVLVSPKMYAPCNAPTPNTACHQKCWKRSNRLTTHKNSPAAQKHPTLRH